MTDYSMIETIHGWTKKQYAIAKMFHFFVADGWVPHCDMRGLVEVKRTWESHRPDEPTEAPGELTDDVWAAKAWLAAVKECRLFSWT